MGKALKKALKTVRAAGRLAMCLTDPTVSTALTALTVLTLLTAPPTAAQFDPSGAWRTWRTPHFRIHAQRHLAAAAQEAAREAERAYALLARELKAPRGPIDIVLADNLDLPLGFAAPFPSNRLGIFVTPPTGSASLNHYDSWLRLVISHELSHIFHLDWAEGLWGGLQTVFGRMPLLFPNAFQPLWVAEGLATYYESRLTTAGRVDGALHRQLLAAAALAEEWPGVGDISVATARWPAGFRPYAWGGEFFALQAREHGDTVVPRFVKRTSRQLWPYLVSRPLGRAGAASVGEGWRALRRVTLEGVPGGSLPGLARRLIERGLRGEPHPRVAADGRWLAYVRSDGEDAERVVVRSLANGATVTSHRVNGIPDLAWVGDVLYVAQLEYGSPVEIRRDLYRWGPAGMWQRLTVGGRFDHPFATAVGTPGAVDVAAGAARLVHFPEGGGTAHVLAAPRAAGWMRVAASPDGSWMAGVRHADGRWDVVLWPADRPADVRYVTNDGPLDEDVAWSPDGRWLLFASEREGLPQIFAYHLEDGTIERWTTEPTGAREPAMGAAETLFYSTLLADGFALVSVQRPARAVAPIGGGADAPWEPAPEVEIREGGYAPWAALRPHYWIPLGHGEGATGSFLGAFTGGADPIGRTSYALFAALDTDSVRRWEVDLTVAHTRWKAVSVDAGVRHSWSLSSALTLNPVRDTVRFAERTRGMDAGLTWRWRRWRSAAAVRWSGELEETLLLPLDSTVRFAPGTQTELGTRVAFRFEHLERPELAISPEDGVVVRGVARRRRVLGEQGWSYELRGGVQGFWGLALPGFAHWVLAGQVAAGRSGGPLPPTFTLGGAAADLTALFPELVLVQSAGRRFPLRGYPAKGGLTRVVTGIAELRVPLVLVGKGLRPFPLGADRVSFSVFGEGGRGWARGKDPSQLVATPVVGDVGGEVLVNLALGYAGILPLRLGAAVALRSGLGAERGDVRAYAAVGRAF